MPVPLVGNLGTSELLIIAAILILLFGAKKLPDLARGSGRALRIFKAETKGLHDDEGNDDDAGSSSPTTSHDTRPTERPELHGGSTGSGEASYQQERRPESRPTES